MSEVTKQIGPKVLVVLVFSIAVLWAAWNVAGVENAAASSPVSTEHVKQAGDLSSAVGLRHGVARFGTTDAYYEAVSSSSE